MTDSPCALLSEGSHIWTETVLESAEPFDVSLPAISKHLRVLEHAGLLIQIKKSRIRHCRLIARPLKDASDWIGNYRRCWKARFDSLEKYFNQQKEQR